MLKIAPDHRLASRDADFSHPRHREHLCNTGNFFKGQEFIAWHKGITWAKDFTGHAIDATEIASICH